MTSLFEKLIGARLLIAGDVMLDQYWHGSTSRISPEAPVPIVHVQAHENRPGGAANVAINASALGADVHLFACVGKDAHAQALIHLLKQAQLHLHLDELPDIKTTSKLRVIAQQQQLIRLDSEVILPTSYCPSWLNDIPDYLERSDVLVLSDYAKGTLSCAATLIQMAQKANKPVIVDPKGLDFSIYRGASLITPNFQEFQAIVGACSCEKEIEDRALELCKTLDIKAILITRSDKGMSLISTECAALHLPTQAQEVFDVTGAGDTVVATLAVALAKGMPLDQALTLANIAAGLVVSQLGTACVSLHELDQATAFSEIHAAPNLSDDACFTEEQLLTKVEQLKRKGRRVVMTNGCFDVLHPGHIHCLEKARELGDYLIVAINDDASVAQLKGPQRPVFSLAHRIKMLSSLACVDAVVPFSELTPERLYLKLTPHIVVKGGDYLPEQIAGAKHIIDSGGEVCIIPFLEGYSSSKIMAYIQDHKT